MYTYAYPHPAVAVDIVAFSMIKSELSALLIQRGEPPFEGQWALPGGFVLPNETVEAAAHRELREETGVEMAELKQFGIYSEPGRDPRERVISIAYLACLRADDVHLQAGTDARHAAWQPVDIERKLAFDHDEILRNAKELLISSYADLPLIPRLLPKKFRLSELQATTEALIGRGLDKRNFRRMLEDRGWLEPTEEIAIGRHRPAQLYRLKG